MIRTRYGVSISCPDHEVDFTVWIEIDPNKNIAVQEADAKARAIESFRQRGFENIVESELTEQRYHYRHVTNNNGATL
ncbi:MAG: hypothetical protein KGZ54_11820 [Dethiobacter sp.]|nr:hypothetical protein [Dethiobacter sp.]MBS3902685.1 hypothetical protein [Dethiobacter sp.]MBS3989742.1 hypothetical protein [Dethiobacter sp.]